MLFRSTDPLMYEKAKKIDKISYEEMLEMSSLGAKVMQPISVQASMINDIPVHVRSVFSEKAGTTIISQSEIDYKKVVTGIAYSKNDAKITLVGVADIPGVAATIFKPFGKNNINIDMVIQTAASKGKKTDVTFTVKREDLLKTLKLIEENNQYLKDRKSTRLNSSHT